MRTFFTDAYTDRPSSPRAALVFEIERLKCLLWADGGSDADLRHRIAQLESELAAHDAKASAP